MADPFQKYDVEEGGLFLGSGPALFDHEYGLSLLGYEEEGLLDRTGEIEEVDVLTDQGAIDIPFPQQTLKPSDS